MKLPALPKLPKLPALPRLTGSNVSGRMAGLSAGRTRADATPPPPTAVFDASYDAPVSAIYAATPSSATGRPSVSLWRVLLKPFRMINWRVLTAALFGMGILHILATLAAPQLAIATAYDRLARVLPANRMVVLPQIAAGAQPLPFMSPALRYAMCRFDTATSPVALAVELRETGSSLTVYSVDGEAIYTAAQSEVPQHRLLIVPADGRFLGLTPEARGLQRAEILSASLPADRGIAVFALPDRGASYRSAADQQLAAATCQPRSAQE